MNEDQRQIKMLFRSYTKKENTDSHRDERSGAGGSSQNVCGYKNRMNSFLAIFRLEVCRSISSRLDTPAPALLLSSTGKLVFQVLRLVRTTQRTQLRWLRKQYSHLDLVRGVDLDARGLFCLPACFHSRLDAGKGGG